MERKIARAGKSEKAEQLKKNLNYLLEQAEMVKDEAADHLPESLMSMAFIDESLQTGGDYFSIDFKNFFYRSLFWKRAEKKEI